MCVPSILAYVYVRSNERSTARRLFNLDVTQIWSQGRVAIGGQGSHLVGGEMISIVPPKNIRKSITFVGTCVHLLIGHQNKGKPVQSHTTICSRHGSKNFYPVEKKTIVVIATDVEGLIIYSNMLFKKSESPPSFNCTLLISKQVSDFFFFRVLYCICVA